MNFKPFAGFILLSTGLCLGQSLILPDMAPGPTSEPKKPISFDLSAIDKSADPCTDFYQFACGNWKKNNPIPADQTRWGRFNELSERNNYLLYQELKAAAEAPTTPLQRKYGDFFAACMNDELTNKLGAKPIEPALGKIAAFQDKSKLALLVSELGNQDGVALFFGFGSQQDQKDSTKQIGGMRQAGLSLPDRDYYLKDDARSQKIREQYLAHVTAMFALLGDSPDKAAAEAKSVMTIETALAKGSTPRVEMRDPANVYHIKTIAELKALAPGFDWQTYLAQNQLGKLMTVNVATPGFFTAMDSVVSSSSVDDLKSYMRWHVVHEYASILSDPFAKENFNFFEATLAGQKEQTAQWKRCTATTDRALGEAVGQDWVAKNFPPAAKQNMDKLVDQLTVALNKDIAGLDWMSDATKAEAEKKLAAFRRKIGYPDAWRDYSKLTIKRDDAVGNAERVAYFNKQRNLDKIGKAVNEREWGMTPPTVNASYNPSMNDINFPAGILQPPFYDFAIDPAVNYGAIGVVIGHEMTHAFDDEGSQFDPLGNVRMWWTPEDRRKFDERTDCEVKEYSGFQVAEGAHLNGKLTLGENTADNGGLRIAYAALMQALAEQGPGAMDKKIDGFTPAQRYFIGFGQVWCENTREQTARMRALTDPHSSGQWRTNGTVQNFDEFGKAFGCRTGQPMMPTNACHVW